MLPQLPSSCLLGHITGLFFCLYIKVCHPHIFKFQIVNHLSIISAKKRMTLVVFDIECLEGTFVKELGIFKDGTVLGYTLLPSNDYKPTFQAKWNTKNLHGINWNNGKVDYSDPPTIIHQHCSPTTKYFAKGLEKCKILSDFGCPKASKLISNEDTIWECSNYPYRHKKTLHCAEKKGYAYGTWALNFFVKI